MDHNPDPPMLLTIPEAAGHLRCSSRTVYNMIDRGQLPDVRDPLGRRRVPRSAIEAIVEGEAA